MASVSNWRSRIVGSDDVAPEDLLANPRNWRIHPKAQQDALAGALDQVGWVQRVIVNRQTGHLVDGHLRVELALRRNEPSVPVEYVDLTPEEEGLVLASLDPISAMAATDDEKLRQLLAEVEFDSRALENALRELAPTTAAGLTDPDDVPAVDEAEVYVKRGDLWMLGEHRLLCGDSTDGADVARLLVGERPRAVVTSPPYNQQLDTFKPSGMQKENPGWVRRMASAYSDSMPESEYQAWQRDLVDSWWDLTADDGAVFYNHKHRYRDARVVSPVEWLRETRWGLRQEVIWNRSSSITLNARMFMPVDERIYWLAKPSGFHFTNTTDVKAWGTVWTVAPKAEAGVSAPFPVELPKRCIAAVTEPGDHVYEPFSGSGTTMIAAEQLGRRCYAMEIDPRYVQVAIERWEKFTGRKAERADG